MVRLEFRALALHADVTQYSANPTDQPPPPNLQLVDVPERQ
jgi:hypothetical protein